MKPKSEILNKCKFREFVNRGNEAAGQAKRAGSAEHGTGSGITSRMKSDNPG
jgi:hypothetical protein